MATRILTIGTVTQDLAQGQVLGQWSFVVTDASGATVQDVKQDDPIFSADYPVGDYTAKACRLDTTGAEFGNTVTAQFTVAAVAQGAAAASLTVTLS
jgi:hypothetical protein